MPKKPKTVKDHLKMVRVRLAGLLSKEKASPDVKKFEGLIEVRKGRLSGLFPQRGTRRKPGPVRPGPTNESR